MNDLGDDWKQSALADFRRWLDDLPEDPEDALDAEAPEPPECDLHDLFAEFAALRQEIRLQNREQAKAVRELGKAADSYEISTRLIQRREEDLETFEKRIAREAENRCLQATLDIRDSLLRGRDAAGALRARPRLFGRPPRGLDAVVEGYEMALRRFDRMLSRFGVRPLLTIGRPFDSRTMHAVETRRAEELEDEIVAEELLGGFLRGDEVLRLADVAVNRLDPRE